MNLKTKIQTKNLDFFYGDFQAINKISIDIYSNKITALIGPSGCGKSTFLRVLNRMNDTIEGTRVAGEVLLDGADIYAPDVDVVDLRQKIGMVFQKPNPFPQSIYNNAAYGPRILGWKTDIDQVVESSLQAVGLWDEVKDKLATPALALNPGQQQRLCIARTIAINPDVILMDEPCSSLDPIATLQVEELMRELSAEYTIVIVTHSMQQAARASNYTGFFNMGADRAGYLVEFGETNSLFVNPQNELTEQYITGRFG